MAAFKLPRLKANLAIVSSNGKPTDFFLRLFNIDFAQRIEQQETSQEETLLAIQAIQEQQTAQLGLIYEALELAGIAIGQDPNTKKSSSTVTITDAWTFGSEVEFIATTPSNVSVVSSGVYAQMGLSSANFVSGTGQLRIVEIDGGVDTVIGGPWSFSVSLFPVPPGDPQAIIISNPSEVNSFTYASATSGDIKYRVDARLTTPGQILADVILETSAKRPA